MNLLGEFRIGEDIAIALDAVTGDPADVSTIEATMRPANRSGGALELDQGAVGIALGVSSRPAAGDVPVGWTFTLAAVASAALTAGYYGIDAKLTVGSGVDITDSTAFIRLTEAAIA